VIEKVTKKSLLRALPGAGGGAPASNASGYSQHQVPDGLACGFEPDFDVVPQACQAVHEFAFRYIVKVSPQQSGEPGLR